MPLAAARPLLDLLGSRWRVPVAAVAVAWDACGDVAAFGMGDGSVAMVTAAWDGAPTVRPRAGGGVELVPGVGGPPNVAHLAVHDGACRAIAADPDGGFLTGGDDGRIARVRPNGAAETLVPGGGEPALVAVGRGGWRVSAIGTAVRRLGHATAGIDVAGPVCCLALDPTGARVAVGHRDGVTLWAGGDAPRVLSAPGDQRALAWSSASDWLASLTPDGVAHVWTMPAAEPVRLAADGPVTALAALGASLVTGVGGRVACWSVGHATAPASTVCGVTSQARITCLAAHPKRSLIAAGYANGAAALSQPGSTALLVLRGAGEGAVSALAFAPRGDALAIGTDGGEIAVLAIPEMLFRESPGTP